MSKFKFCIVLEPDEDATWGFIGEFEREREFLEHIISEYSKFLPPTLMRSIMEIEDGLDEIIRVLWSILRLIIPYMKELENATKLDKSRLEHIIEFLRKGSESRLQYAIHKITKEINRLNKLGLGFYP